jgi:hypothetical protein
VAAQQLITSSDDAPIIPSLLADYQRHDKRKISRERVISILDAAISLIDDDDCENL